MNYGNSENYPGNLPPPRRRVFAGGYQHALLAQYRSMPAGRYPRRDPRAVAGPKRQNEIARLCSVFQDSQILSCHSSSPAGFD